MVNKQLMVQGIQRQFRKAMMSYCKGALEHVDRESRAEIPSLAQQLATHRESAAVTPMFALLAYRSLVFAVSLRLIDWFPLGTLIKSIYRMRYSSTRR